MAEKHLDLDQVMSLQEPITFKANGKTYRVNAVTDEMFEAVDALSEKTKGDQAIGPCASLAGQIGIFTGKPASEFKKLDIFALRKIIKHITDNLNDPLEEVPQGPDAGA